MIKIGKLIRIFVKTIIAIFLLTFFAVCVLLGILHVKATQSIGAAKFERELLEVAGCYICRPYPPSKDWIECSRLKEAWKYLKTEKVQKIAFCDADYGDANLSPDNWGGWEIIGQERINQTLQLLLTAKKGNNISIIWMGKMKIITDKHKFIIPIHWNDQGVYGYEWTSAELREQLRKWGFDDPNRLSESKRYRQGRLKINSDNQLVEGQLGQIGLFDGPHSDMSLALGMGETSISRAYQ